MPFVGQIVLYKNTVADKAQMTAEGCNAPTVSPAIITAVLTPGVYPDANIKLIVDGASADYWRCTIKRGTGDGQWDYLP